MKIFSENKRNWWLLIVAAFFINLTGCSVIESSINDINYDKKSVVLFEQDSSFTIKDGLTKDSQLPSTLVTDIPDYDGQNQIILINNGIPTFSESDLNLVEKGNQFFSDLDYLNRVGVANANIGPESFPNEERERLYIDPTGWNQKKMEDGQWLYNRCHLIGFQLTGENNNMLNLMTGTRSFNTPCMLEYENQIADYITSTGNHVRYRVTPYFIDDELVARGIQLEAQSIEDDGLSYNVFIYNVQNGYTIDYMTGKVVKN